MITTLQQLLRRNLHLRTRFWREYRATETPSAFKGNYQEVKGWLMAEEFINYGALIDEAMHIIVKKSLEIASVKKLPGDHHFFISFMTKFPDVTISEKLKRKYPQEMTIVLQHQFEELLIDDKAFSVVLSFDNVKERVVVPFASITAFADPSVKFGLQFRHVEEYHPEHDDVVMTEEERAQHNTDLKKSGKKMRDIIKESGATNVITLDSFRKKHD